MAGRIESEQSPPSTGLPGAVVHLRAAPRTTILGDVHGKPRVLEAVLAERQVEAGLAAGEHLLISLGDLLDRGVRTVEDGATVFTGAEAVMDRMGGLSRRYPGRVAVLLGNHEQQHLRDIGKRRLGPGGVSGWDSQGTLRLTADRLDFLRTRPIAGVVASAGARAIVVHGGPARCDCDLEALSALGSARALDTQAGMDLLWGNPSWSPRGAGPWPCFTRLDLRRFLSQNGATVLIRGHRDEDEAFEFGEGLSFISVHTAKGPRERDEPADGYAYVAWDPPAPPRLVRRVP
ncbi:MAG: serine/threonine protein phosphatase [Candidatus Riflebacteria bacterium]|nr:serine/threonine protein phosphatase [Candidatus Riflebacteria bacterium]